MCEKVCVLFEKKKMLNGISRVQPDSCVYYISKMVWNEKSVVLFSTALANIFLICTELNEQRKFIFIRERDCVNAWQSISRVHSEKQCKSLSNYANGYSYK